MPGKVKLQHQCIVTACNNVSRTSRKKKLICLMLMPDVEHLLDRTHCSCATPHHSVLHVLLGRTLRHLAPTMGCRLKCHVLKETAQRQSATCSLQPALRRCRFQSIRLRRLRRVLVWPTLDHVIGSQSRESSRANVGGVFVLISMHPNPPKGHWSAVE